MVVFFNVVSWFDVVCGSQCKIITILSLMVMRDKCTCMYKYKIDLNLYFLLTVHVCGFMLPR